MMIPENLKTCEFLKSYQSSIIKKLSLPQIGDGKIISEKPSVVESRIETKIPLPINIIVQHSLQPNDEELNLDSVSSIIAAFFHFCIITNCQNKRTFL